MKNHNFNIIMISKVFKYKLGTSRMLQPHHDLDPANTHILYFRLDEMVFYSAQFNDVEKN